MQAAQSHIGTARLIKDDCLVAFPGIPSNSIDLLATDPPYNLGLFMKNRATNLARMRDNFFVAAGWDNCSLSEWEILLDRFFAESARVLRAGGSALIFMAVIKVETVVRIAEKHGFYYKTTGIWHKTNPMPRNMNLHFINSIECWIYFTYGSRTGTFNNRGKAIHDFIESGLTPRSEKLNGGHPTQKPLSVMRHFISLLSNENDTVLDPFMGSGSTGVAAVELGRNFIGIEMEHEYYEVARRRILGGSVA